jgi:RimJ/RimL family protein N-acetyltransferase
MSIIKTERLTIRPYKPSDSKDYLALVTDQEVMLHIEEDCPTAEIARIWWDKIINGGFPGQKWAVESIEESKYIGHVLLNPYGSEGEHFELGYLVCKDEWGKGYGTEIAGAVSKYSREDLGLNRIYATVDDDHETSIKILKKTGFMFLRYDFDNDGRFSVYVLNHRKNRESTEQTV